MSVHIVHYIACCTRRSCAVFANRSDLGIGRTNSDEDLYFVANIGRWHSVDVGASHPIPLTGVSVT
jgi:hypothetical protein